MLTSQFVGIFRHVARDTPAFLCLSGVPRAVRDTPIARTFRSLCIPLLATLLVGGCASTKTSNTPRTGIEQLLISNAVDESLNSIDFQPFYGKKVYVDEKYMDCIDKNYIVSSIRHRALRSGARLTTKAEDADIVLEPRSGGVGTDSSESFVGIPEITLPGMLTLPEVRLATKSNQTGVAKIGLVAYDAKTMEVLGDGGVSLANSSDSNWYIFGIGPYRDGSLIKEKARSHDQTEGIVPNELPRYVAFAKPAETGHSEPARLKLSGAEEAKE